MDGVGVWKEGVVFPGFATKPFFSLYLSAPLCALFFKIAINVLCTALKSAAG